MTIPPEVRTRWLALRGLAVALVAFAGVMFFLWPSSFWLRLAGLLAILVTVWLVRLSNAYARRPQGQVVGERSFAKAARRIRWPAWTLAAGALVGCVILYLIMYADALHGGKEGWPAYAFAAAVVALAATGGYVIMKLFQ